MLDQHKLPLQKTEVNVIYHHHFIEAFIYSIFDTQLGPKVP